MSESNQPVKKKFYFSFSSITKLMREPKKFYDEYILKNYDDSSKKFLDVGSLAHQLTLDPETFAENIVVMTCKIPSDSPRAVIDTVFKLYGAVKLEEEPDRPLILDNFKKYILLELERQDLYQNLKDTQKKGEPKGTMHTGDEKRLEKILIDSNRIYFTTLGTGYKKIIVDFQMIEKAQKKRDAIMADERACELLSEQDGIETRFEMKLEAELAGYNFGLRGILDCVKVNNKTKTIIINDLKTTSKTLKKWEDDFIESPYMYWLQPIVYKELVLSLLPTEKDRLGWTLQVNFIVVDCDDNVHCFPVSPESLAKWEGGAKNVYDKAKWHLDNNKYQKSYEYYNNLVSL